MIRDPRADIRVIRSVQRTRREPRWRSEGLSSACGLFGWIARDETRLAPACTNPAGMLRSDSHSWCAGGKDLNLTPKSAARQPTKVFQPPPRLLLQAMPLAIVNSSTLPSRSAYPNTSHPLYPAPCIFSIPVFPSRRHCDICCFE